jgi:Helicase associated domain
MDYSSPSNGAVIAANSGKSPKRSSTVALFPHHNLINIDSASHLAVISKAFRQLQQQQQQQQQQQRTQIINNRNTMNSNFSDILRSNKPPGISTMINSTSPLDILANAGGGGGISGNGFSGRLSAMNNSAIIANMTAATSLRRPLKRTKLEGNEDPEDGNHAFPPSVVLIPHHPPQQLLQEQQQLAEYSSEESIGDDTESRESVDRSNSPASNHHQRQQDGARSGVRFREYQAEIWSEKFEELCLFRRENGHCHVPHHYQENQGEYLSVWRTKWMQVCISIKS